MRKAFLRAPVEFSRISSNFNLRRKHPLYKRTMPHRGIDYAAPTGTPILASGDGKIQSASKSSSNGNFIVVQHGEAIRDQVSAPVTVRPRHTSRQVGWNRATSSATSVRPGGRRAPTSTTSSWSTACTRIRARSNCRTRSQSPAGVPALRCDHEPVLLAARRLSKSRFS